MENIFFNGWAGPFRTLVIGIFAYAMLVVFLRVAGNRTLSKMNAFDFLVTVAMGSTLASVLLTQAVSLLQGAVAFSLLIGLQFAVTWSSVRWPWVQKIVTSEPIILIHHGVLLNRAMLHARVTEIELMACVRQAGLAEFQSVAALVLETDGTLSVIPRSSSNDDTNLPIIKNVKKI